MEKLKVTITEDERAKCRNVVEAFAEYFDEMGDCVVADAGKYGFVWLRWFNGIDFDAEELYTSSLELFDALYEAWQEHHLLTPVLKTPASELEYETLYDMLSEEQKEAFRQKKEYFRKKAFGN